MYILRFLTYTVVDPLIVRPLLEHANTSAEYLRHESRALFAVSSFHDVAPRTPDLHILPLTCRAAHPLDAEIERFVSDPRSKGTIIVALGTIAGGWPHAPAASYIAFRDALWRFSDYRVVWQCDLFEDGEDPERLPEGHIWKRRFIPQNDLLHHPKTRLFVSHCGLKSATEAICAGVPVAAIPFFSDQYMIAGTFLGKGSGVLIDKRKLSEHYVYNTLASALSDERMYQAALRDQRLSRDQIVQATNLSTYLIDHAIRHGDRLRLLHSRGRKLSFLQLYSEDTALLLSSPFIVLAVLLGFGLCGLPKWRLKH